MRQLRGQNGATAAAGRGGGYREGVLGGRRAFVSVPIGDLVTGTSRKGRNRFSEVAYRK